MSQPGSKLSLPGGGGGEQTIPRSPGCQAGPLVLTVGIQEGEHLRLRHAGSQQSGSDQALSLLLPHHPHDLQLLYVLLQLFL